MDEVKAEAEQKIYEILVEQQTPQGVLVCDHAGRVINKLSLARGQAGLVINKLSPSSCLQNPARGS